MVEKISHYKSMTLCFHHSFHSSKRLRVCLSVTGALRAKVTVMDPLCSPPSASLARSSGSLQTWYACLLAWVLKCEVSMRRQSRSPSSKKSLPWTNNNHFSEQLCSFSQGKLTQFKWWKHQNHYFFGIIWCVLLFKWFNILETSQFEI